MVHGESALTLMGLAARAVNSNRPDVAIKHLRRALDISEGPVRKNVAVTLSVILSNRAADRTDQLLSRDDMPLNEPELRRMNAEFEESANLDPSNSCANSYLARLIQLIALLDDVGGSEALFWRRRAAAAYQSGRLDEAISDLEQSVSVSSNSARVRGELSVLLTERAVAQLRAAFKSADPTIVRTASGEAAVLLQRAVKLDRGNADAAEVLSTIKPAL